MSKINAFALATAIGISLLGAANANAGSVSVDTRGCDQVVEVDDYGRHNDTDVFQRGCNNGTNVTTRGYRLKTHVTQMGRNGGANVYVEGNHDESHIFTGICPPGSPRRNVELAGNGRLDIIVLPCGQ